MTSNQTHTSVNLPDNGLLVLYDGACPFCRNYVALQNLREEVGKVRLLNARDNLELVSHLSSLGMDINEGMAAYFRQNWFFGPDCVFLLTQLNRKDRYSTLFWRTVFFSKWATKLLYPPLKLVRSLTLRLLGVQKIEVGQS